MAAPPDEEGGTPHDFVCLEQALELGSARTTYTKVLCDSPRISCCHPGIHLAATTSLARTEEDYFPPLRCQRFRVSLSSVAGGPLGGNVWVAMAAAWHI